MEANKKSNEGIKSNNGDAQKKQCSHKVRGVSPEECLWWEISLFVKEVGVEPGVEERGGYGWREW